MINLVINESIKLFRKTSTIVMIGLMLLFIIGLGAILKYNDVTSDSQPDPNWKAGIESQIESDKQSLAEMGERNANLNSFYTRQIALNEYRLAHDLPPSSEKHIWTFVENAMPLIDVVGLCIIIIAAGIVASEFSSGTIKLLLIRPIHRAKILFAKYITVIFMGLLFLAIIYLSSSVLGWILFGTPSTDTPYLTYSGGEVVERSMAIQLMFDYLLYSVNLLMITTMAFMISAVFRHNAFAIGISIFLYFMGANAVTILAGFFDWPKYILFANTNLTVYFNGLPPIEGMTLGFSITMLIVYFIGFHLLAFGTFMRRDVSA